MKFFCNLILCHMCTMFISTTDMHINFASTLEEEDMPLKSMQLEIENTKNNTSSCKICRLHKSISIISNIKILMLTLILIIKGWNLIHETSIILNYHDFTELLYATTLIKIIENISLPIMILFLPFYRQNMIYILQIIYMILVLLLFLQSYVYFNMAQNYSQEINISSINLLQFLFLTYHASVWSIQLQSYIIFIASTITLVMTMINFVIKLISIFMKH